MRRKSTIYTVEHEKTRNVFFQGTFKKCKDWLTLRPDWEQYIIVDPVTNLPVHFILIRGDYETRSRKSSSSV